jgi:hypothetical protein
MIDENQFGLGYLRDQEDHANLAATATPFDLPEKPITFSAPASISHRGWKKPPKNQGQVGRCSGASRASGEEILNWIATGGQIVHLSMDYNYVENQKLCDLWGQDNGATIDASMRAAGLTGVVTEDVMPQSPGYNPNIPAGAEDKGKLHVIKSHAILKSADDCRKWLETGQGVILIGIAWSSLLSQVTSRITMNELRGRPTGGHALCISGYNVNGDFDLENSWGTQWGDQGWAWVAPDVMDSWGNTETLIGISDLTSFGYRQIKTWGEMFG